MDKIPITNIGFEKLEEELKLLKSVERPTVIKSIAEAREHGDLSENAEYHAAKEKQSFIEGRIADLENKISRAEIINTKKLKSNKIIFGATVTLEELGKKIGTLDYQNKQPDIKKKESGAGFGFKISTELIAALAVGVGIGLIVDNYFNTKPIGLIIFFIFGALAGFLNVYRVMRRIEKQR